MYMLFSDAVQEGWKSKLFDVQDAFLVGRKNERDFYIKPPREGIPGVPPGSLLRFKKGAFARPETPRLWWMKFRDVFVEAGFTPSKRHPATFYFNNKKSEYRGKVVCHVDDSVWAGAGENFRAAQQKVGER